MSRVIKGTLGISTRYVNSLVEESFEITVDDNATDDEINDEIEQLWIDFRASEVDGGWDIESDEIINE